MAKRVTFEEHLDKLAENYGEDYSGAPTVDEIFQGSYKLEAPLSVIQAFSIAGIALEQLEAAWKKFGSKPNVIVDQYLNNYFRFLGHQPVEIGTVFRQKAVVAGITFKDDRLYSQHFNDRKP